jgi:DNA-binding NtrC family response regulator
MNPQTFLLISEDSDLRQILHEAFPQANIHSVRTVAAALSDWSTIAPTLVIGEGNLHSLAPLLAYARQTPESPPVLVIGNRCALKETVELMRAGAADYLPKPVILEELYTAVTRAARQSSPVEPIPPRSPFSSIISVSPQMNLMKQLAEEMAATDATVLLTGESGTGKELFARAIHAASPRARGPLIALNCAGIPEHLLEAELFGYRQGAFTDAKQTKPGRFQLAEGGTLFLDEIGEMSPTAQAKLLRVLEDHTIDPLGATRSCTVNIRVVAATNEDLPAHIKSGRFRLDLYYRLNVYQLRIPPLRERPEDIEPILLMFLERARREHGCRINTIDPAAMAMLKRHEWPGNVRELHNVVEWLTITCKEPVIGPQHLPPAVQSPAHTAHSVTDTHTSLLSFGLSFEQMERKLLEEALHKASGNVSEASRLLKMTRNTLRYRMAKHHL